MVPHVHMVPHMSSVFMSYMTLIVPHTLYQIGIIWSPKCMYSPPVYYMTLIVHHTLYGTGITWSPQHVLMVPHM